jgi:uncharacterized protein
MRILPRQEKFFHLFLDQARIILDAAALFSQAVRQGGPALISAAAKIQEMEKAGDDIIHDIFLRLNQTFITPIDPEDIHVLSSRLDDVLDGIEDTSHRIASYKLDPAPKPVVELADILYRSAESIELALKALEKDQRVLEHCMEINRLEDSADWLVRKAVAQLFEEEKDPIMLIKKKEILEFLEETTDRCEDVADVLQNVVVKNS